MKTYSLLLTIMTLTSALQCFAGGGGGYDVKYSDPVKNVVCEKLPGSQGNVAKVTASITYSFDRGNPNFSNLIVELDVYNKATDMFNDGRNVWFGGLFEDAKPRYFRDIIGSFNKKSFSGYTMPSPIMQEFKIERRSAVANRIFVSGRGLWKDKDNYQSPIKYDFFGELECKGK